MIARLLGRGAAAGLLGGLFASSVAIAGDHAPAVALTSPEQFLVDKEADLVAIVTVTRSETRWVILPDGDHVPLVVNECRMDEVLSGTPDWTVGTSRSVLQSDYTSLIFEPIAPPAIAGRRYLLWANRSPEGGEVPALAPWTAHPQGVLLIRHDQQDFAFWNGKSYAVSAIRRALNGRERLPLDQIIDPARRLKVAAQRLQRGQLGDEKAFIRGLLVNVIDAEGQSRHVEQAPPSEGSWDRFGMARGEKQPHALWFNSLALLRDIGRDEMRRSSVVAALTPVAQTARRPIRLAAALALVDLGSDAGRAALVEGYETEWGAVSSDPPDQMTFPGRYPYDDSSVTASAHALARVGDRRGLAHSRPEVRLAAAEALKEKPDPELMTTLKELSVSLEPEIERLRKEGKLAEPRRPGDYTNRYPDNWVRALRLLAYLGDDDSLRRLVDAYLADAATYASVETPLVPTGRPVSWSRGPSPGHAILGADATPAGLAMRLQRLFGRDSRWETPAFKALRASIEAPSSEERKPAQRLKPSEAEIVKLLADPDPGKRAQGLAAAGYHQLPTFYDRVVDVAVNGAGIERQAAVYALGFYGRDLPDAVLRQLMSSADVQVRFSAFELATRRDGQRFARESMELVRSFLSAAKSGHASQEQERVVEYLPRVLARLARGPLPPALLDGLKIDDPIERRVVVVALELGGNPDAVPFLNPLLNDPDAAVRDAALSAIRALGPLRAQ